MSSKPVIKVLLVQTANMNLGDQVLADNDCFLLEKSLKKHGKKFEIFRYSISSRDITQIKYVDAVIFAGGIIKDTNEKFHLYIPEIINEANRLNVPVFMSAIGVEEFHPDSESSQLMKAALNLPVVKGISCRDDIETLKKDYITNPNIRIMPVIDPAIWCKKCYSKEFPLFDFKKKELIGLGITRHLLFTDYGHPEITKEMQLDFWKKVVENLESKGLPWVLFTNGDTYDERFCKEVLAYIGHGTKLNAPRDGASLVKMISNFRGVIAGRMHSNIIAYSLKIPSIGFIWNQKLRFWAEKIGHTDRFMEIASINPDTAVSLLIKSMTEKTGPSRDKKALVYKELDYFVVNHCKYREKAPVDVDLAKHMVAASLGGIETRYRNTNSPEALELSINNGYQCFEADVRLTEDNELVCVKKWHKDIFHILNYERPDDLLNKPIAQAEFLELKTYNRFSTMSFQTLLQMLKEKEPEFKYTLFLNIGKCDTLIRDVFFEKLKSQIDESGIDKNKIIIRFERKDSFKKFKELGLNCKYAYHFTTKETEKEARIAALAPYIEYCKKNKTYISLRDDLYYDYIAKEITNAGLKACIFSFIKVDNVINAINNGAYLVGSHYYDVKYIERLIK